MVDPEVAQILERAPGYAYRYLQLVEWADGDPGAAAVFADLADYVAGLVAEVERVRPALEACLAGIESVAESSEDAEDLVVWSFFDSLSPDHVRSLETWLGPRTRALLDEIDQLPAPPGTGRPRERP